MLNIIFKEQNFGQENFGESPIFSPFKILNHMVYNGCDALLMQC